MRRPRLPEPERARIIVMRFDFHRTYANIAHRIKCSVETARRVCLQHSHHIDREKRRHHGGKPLLSSKLKKHMFDIIRSNKNLTSAELSRHLFHHDHVNVSARTTKYLLPFMPLSSQFTFVHDNAGPHRPIQVRKFLHEYAVKLIYKWPANSPDFNPIEHVWSWMVNYVNKLKPYDRITLEEAINSAWSAIPQTIIRGYIDGLPERLQAVYNNGGARLD